MSDDEEEFVSVPEARMNLIRRGSTCFGCPKQCSLAQGSLAQKSGLVCHEYKSEFRSIFPTSEKVDWDKIDELGV